MKAYIIKIELLDSNPLIWRRASCLLADQRCISMASSPSIVRFVKRERATKTIAHNIEEFRLLFPDEKVTKPRMAEWCGLENKDRGCRK